MEKLVNIIINGKSAQVPANYTILQAAEEMGIFIPRLCFLKGINENSSCRLCVVEIKGLRTLKNSCTVKVSEGMEVLTNTKRVKTSVVETLKLIAASHRFECWNCPREHNCELLDLLRRYGVSNKMGESSDFAKKPHLVNSSIAIEFDSSKCVLCGRCIAACEKLAGTNVLDFNQRGFVTFVGSALNHEIEDSGCIYCGKCIGACPTGAIHERSEIDEVMDVIEAEKNMLLLK